MLRSSRSCKAGDMSDESAQANGAGPDFEKAHSRLGRDRQRIEQAQARALEVVTERREDVEKVAKALVERGRVSSQQVDYLLSGVAVPAHWLE